MADIHVVQGTIKDQETATYLYVLHIPTNASPALKAKAVLAPEVGQFESLVDFISAAELDQIRAGDLVEEPHSITRHEADPATDYLQRLRDKWAERAALVPSEFARRFQWYLNDYSAT